MRPSLRILEHSFARTSSVLHLDSIKSKIVVFALLATLIPAVSTALISYAKNKSALEEKAKEELSAVGSQTAREMDLWIKERFYDVRVFRASFEVSENLVRIRRAGQRSPDGLEAVARLNDYLRAVQDRFSDYEELLVIDPSNQVIASGGAGRSAPSLPSGWIETVRREQDFLGQPYWDTVFGKPVVMVAIPIEEAGRLLGVLSAKVSFDSVTATLQRFVPGETGHVYLLSAGGTIISSSSEIPQTSMETALDPEILIALEEAETSTVEYEDASGVPVIGTLNRVPRFDWLVVAEIPQHEAYGQVVELRNLALMLVFGLLIIVGAIAYVLGLLIVRPLARLTTAAAEVAGGDLSGSLQVVGGGEVGYLTEVFNDMVARLRQGRAELDAAAEALRKKNEELERLSVTDGLTGLFNRRHLMETLLAEQRRYERTKRPFAVLMVDVDHFKRFNDRFGHQAGDEALLRVAGILRKCTRDVDFPARYGGEEFCLLLSESDLEGAIDVAERIRAEMAGTTMQGESVTVSIGAAEFPIDGESGEAVIASADAALYRAKRQGRNRVVPATRQRPSTKTTQDA